jgi:mono/diheme cytochrome c family protein
MPAWGGDLSTDEIDALAGFITSPNGSGLYTRYCRDCHKSPLQATGNPVELQRAFEQGPRYPGHQNQHVPEWMTTLTADQRESIMNFLAAPDGQRLFEINCSGCHGYGVTFTGTEEQLRTLISQGGQHLTMPAWQGTLSQADLETLAAYVTDPAAKPAGQTLFGQHCSVCHGDKVPSAPDVESARKVIGTGGAHVTMPVWGKILTAEQLDALVQYTLAASKAGGSEAGAKLFADNCSACHGDSGEGGPSPTRPGDMIPPISSAEFLDTRDDTTLRNIIARGQPDLGMNPFGSAYGGPLSDEQVDSLVAYLRAWQANPPQVTAAEVPSPTAAAPALTGREIFAGVCSQCHGDNGEGGSGPALNTPEFQAKYDDQALLALISTGVPSTPMIGVGTIFSDQQMTDLVRVVRELQPGSAGAGTGSGTISFSAQVQPIFQAKCQACHNANTKLGGWDMSSYATVMATGQDAPVVVAGDAKNSLLAQLIQGMGDTPMPPQGGMSPSEIQTILDWITAGAQDN